VKDRLRLLITGGYGTFGGRMVELLESEHPDRIEVFPPCFGKFI
jgi:hypothetical protein